MLTTERKWRLLGVPYRKAGPVPGGHLARPDRPLDLATAIRRTEYIRERTNPGHHGTLDVAQRATVEHALTGRSASCTCCGAPAPSPVRVLVSHINGHDIAASLCGDCVPTFDPATYYARRSWLPDAMGWL